ncbi:MAG TPA: Ppx/GppA family phosphatase [Clostridiales bacterium]|nr:Ppx/GppA family phosphatase [Clostridiales bacterium]
MEKIAIIDLGSNTARLVIVSILPGGYFKVIDELKEPIRLAEGMEIDGFLRPLRMVQTIRTLKTFKTLYESHNVDKVFAYGTAAVRRAKNQDAFVEEIEKQVGIQIQVLSQQEEATLVYTGVINSMEIAKGLIIDIGGGSTKLISYQRRNMLNQDTLPFGALTLTQQFAHIENAEERAMAIEQYVREEMDKIEWLKNIDPETRLIGVGGSIRNLGRISRRLKKYPLDMAHNYVISVEEFDTIYDTIKPLSPELVSRIKGLSSARVDIFPAALSVLAALKSFVQADELTVGGAGLREGAMFRYACPITAEKPLPDIVGHGIYTMLHHFDMNIEHAEHVYDLSMQLFRQLRVLHKLPRPYLKILRVASMLHDAGMTIKYYDHHKHSMYIILNSNLYGIPQKDLIMAALVAGSHQRDSLDNLNASEFLNLLTEEEIEAVHKLGVIVRIAECFDRSCGKVIVGLNGDILGDSVILKIKSEGDSVLEIKNALMALPEFKRAFKKNLEIL